MEQAHEKVYEGLAHGQAVLRPHQAWALWLGSKYTGYPLMATQDPSEVVRAGAGWCSQSAAVLQAAAQNVGLKGRFLDFDGHVVLEVDVGGQRYVADTDFGVLYPFGYEELVRPERTPEIKAALAERGFADATITSYTAIVQDELARPHAWGAAHEPLRYRWERKGVLLSWLLPAVGLVAGGLAFRAARRHRREPHDAAAEPETPKAAHASLPIT